MPRNTNDPVNLPAAAFIHPDLDTRLKTANALSADQRDAAVSNAIKAAKDYAAGADPTPTPTPTPTPVSVTPPSGFGWDFTTHPIAVTKQVSGTFTTTLDPKSKVNAAIFSGAEYWVVLGNPNTGDALSESTGVGSIAVALKKLNDNTAVTGGRIRVKGGVGNGIYDLMNGVNDSGAANGLTGIRPTKHTGFIGYGAARPITGPIRLGLTYTSQGDGSYTAPRNNVARVLDLANTNAAGDYVEIVERADEATVVSSNGFFVTSSGDTNPNRLRIKRPDGAPVTDANTRVILLTDCMHIGGAAVDIYVENMELQGGITGGFNANSGGGRNLVLVDVASKYCGKQGVGGNAFAFSSIVGFVGLWRCEGVRSAQDAISTTGSFFILTVDCKGRDCGMAGSTSNNGLTQHVNMIGIDLNGEYFRNSGGNLRNIGDTQVWALGTYCHDDRGDKIFAGPLDPCDFNLGGNAKGWFQDIRAAGSTISLATDASTITNLRNATLPNQKLTNGQVNTY